MEWDQGESAPAVDVGSLTAGEVFAWDHPNYGDLLMMACLALGQRVLICLTAPHAGKSFQDTGPRREEISDVNAWKVVRK